MTEDQDIEHLLVAAAGGDIEAGEAFYERVYNELRTIARAHRRRWTGDNTLNTTALISEAYLKLAKNKLENYNDRTHFFATASRAMRQILVSYGRRKKSAKRGSNPVRVTLSEVMLQSETTLDDLLYIDELLTELHQDNPRHCRIFECRVFGNMTIAETAAALRVSQATVKRDWTFLSAWIYRALQSDSDS